MMSLLLVGGAQAFIGQEMLRHKDVWDMLRDGAPTVATEVTRNIELVTPTAAIEVSKALSEIPERQVVPVAVGVATAAAMAAAGFKLLTLLAENEDARTDETPYPSGRYDRESAAAYFGRRPLRTLRRFFEIVVPASLFGLKLLRDDEDQATALTNTLTRLGPTFVKVGQALSIRSDLLSPEYCEALSTLQDACPPFDTAIARDIVRQELGAEVDESFVEFPSAPIASASLGQVYKAKIKNLKMGGPETMDVAVKVQRPDVVETIALDLHLLRVAAPIARSLFRLNTDLPELVDVWGVRFVDELDYKREATNAQRFQQSIASTPLRDSVFAPATVVPLTSAKVLTTEWVDGKRLDVVGDASSVCSVAMNAYLTMMLETGLLHADPHPGNLLVETATNRLAILDWGLVTEMDEGLQVAYIEHIAHLVAKDYKKVPADLVKLGFVPQGYEQAIQSSDAVQVLADVYTAFAGGGGAAKIDVPAVLSELQALAKRQGNLFQLPPYFAYIARAFSVLEGIGLQNDPDYAIVGECLPYISQRLVTDKSPRVGKALETFVYSGHAIEPKRVEYLLDGFGSFSDASVATAPSDAAVVQTATQIADILLQADDLPSPTQAIVERELAKLAGASARRAAAAVRDAPLSLAIARTLDPFRILEPLATGRMLQPDDDDHAALATFDRLRHKASPQLATALDDFAKLPAERRAKLVREIASILWERRFGVLNSARRTVGEFASQSADRLLGPRGPP